MGKGDFTRAALAAKAAERAEYYDLLRLARDYARGHKLGAKAAIKTKLFPGISHSVLHNALVGNYCKRLDGVRWQSDILTREEELKLVEWIVGCARGKDPVARRAAFGLCKPVCKCGVVPCPQETLQLCAMCGDIKPNLCRKKACVDARGPLLLTMREETPALQAPSEGAAAPAEAMDVMEMAPGGELPLALARPRRHG